MRLSSVPAMSLGDRLCASREGGAGGGGWVSALSLGSIALKSPWLELGGPFLSFFAQMGRENSA